MTPNTLRIKALQEHQPGMVGVPPHQPGAEDGVPYGAYWRWDEGAARRILAKGQAERPLLKCNDTLLSHTPQPPSTP